MRIKRIELRGFKSFADSTVLQFGPGIAAVVGPNGCGKSNVIDAVRWTLGEQTPGTLRGRAMSDVIFAGSDARAPSNRAEVSLVFDNTDGSFGGRFRRYAEIEVSRRLDRAGESTYEINRERSRLKDVTTLFMDTGVGARAYSIIEQGRVGFVVNARPEERRVLIDEVAGINRFKAQKAETEKRLEATQANLVRVADLCNEMGRQRQGLLTQVRRADRFLDLRRTWKELALRAALAQAVEQHREQGVLRERVNALTTRDGELAEQERACTEAEARTVADGKQAAAAFDLHRDALAEARGRANAIVREVRARKEEAGELGRHLATSKEAEKESTTALASLDGDLAEARIEADAARARLQEALADRARAEQLEVDARARAQELHVRVEATKAAQLDLMMRSARRRSAILALERSITAAEGELQAEDLQREAVASQGAAAQQGLLERRGALQAATERRGLAASELKAAEAGLSILRGKADAANARANAARDQVRSLTARLESAGEVVASLTGFQPGVRALVEWLGQVGKAGAAGRSFAGVVADLLVAPPELEAEVEQVLGPLLGAVVFTDPAGAREAAQWLASRELGSVSLIVMEDAPDPGEGFAAQISDSALPGLAERLLGGVVRYPDVARLPVEQRDLAGVAGRVSLRGGTLTVGVSTDVAAGQLARRRQVRTLEGELASAVVGETEADGAALQARGDLKGAEEERSRLASARHEAELAELGARRDVDEASRRIEAVATEADKSARRTQRLDQQLVAARAEQATAVQELARVDQQDEGQRVALAESKEALRAAEAAATIAGNSLTSARIAQAEARQTAAIGEREARRLETARKALEHRAGKEREQSERAARRLEVLEGLLGALSTESLDVTARIDGFSEAAAPIRLARDRAQAAVTAASEASRAVRGEVRSVNRELGDARIALAERAATLSMVLQRSAQDFDRDLSALVGRLARGESVEIDLPADPDRPADTLRVHPTELAGKGAALAAEAARIEKESRSLGAVNLAARREFDDLDSRWQELTSQKRDLEEAVGDLHRALATIADETRARFLAAFEGVARHFAALYPRLVGGGRGELLLTDPSRPLASGVDVRVEPPGKRLQTLRLLSGGEKAMAAIALVFAVFEVKPSPFCLLDEVDAPLDEANSRRFNAMLRELSAETQFVVITHNRTTMEVADVLYGVTMQEPGASAVVSVQLSQVPG